MKRPAMPLRAVLFDMDDTLFPEQEYVFSGFRAVAQWCAVQWGCDSERTAAELTSIFQAGARGDVFDRWFTSRDLPGTAPIDEMVRIYRLHEPRITLRTGVANVLNDLASRFVLGLVSDGPLEMQQRKFQALRLERWFPCPVFSDAWGPSFRKPNPGPYQEALRRLQVLPEESVYVGDNPAKDFLGARRAGLRSIRLRSPDGLHANREPEEADMAPDLEIVELHQLPQALASLT